MGLDENDYLAYQLYAASKLPRVRKERIRSWIVMTLVFAMLSYLFYSSGHDPLGNYFLIVAVVCLAFYPFYSRWRYKRHYRRGIRDILDNRFGEETELLFENDVIVTRDRRGEVRMNMSEIDEVSEIGGYYFIKSRIGLVIIIAKKKTLDVKDISEKINAMVARYYVKHVIELDWRWR